MAEEGPEFCEKSKVTIKSPNKNQSRTSYHVLSKRFSQLSFSILLLRVSRVFVLRNFELHFENYRLKNFVFFILHTFINSTLIK